MSVDEPTQLPTPRPAIHQRHPEPAFFKQVSHLYLVIVGMGQASLFPSWALVALMLLHSTALGAREFAGTAIRKQQVGGDEAGSG